MRRSFTQTAAHLFLYTVCMGDSEKVRLMLEIQKMREENDRLRLEKLRLETQMHTKLESALLKKIEKEES